MRVYGGGSIKRSGIYDQVVKLLDAFSYTHLDVYKRQELNSIRQDTSNTFFMIEELSTKGELVRDELMEEYIDSYQNTGELPLFSGNI